MLFTAVYDKTPEDSDFLHTVDFLHLLRWMQPFPHLQRFTDFFFVHFSPSPYRQYYLLKTSSWDWKDCSVVRCAHFQVRGPEFDP